MTGGLSISLLESSSINKSAIFQVIKSLTLTPSELSLSNLISKASEIIQAESKSIFEFILTIIPFFINSAISLTSGTQIFSENSFKLNTSHITIVSQVRTVKFCFISSTFFSSFFVTLFDLVKLVSTGVFS